MTIDLAQFHSMFFEESFEGFNGFGAPYYATRMAELARATRSDRFAPSPPLVLALRVTLPFDNDMPCALALLPSN